MNTTTRLNITRCLVNLIAIPILMLFNLNTFAFPNINFSTSIEYPNLDKGTVFAPTFSHSHKLLFYSGKKNGQSVNGYFRSNHFLGWSEYDFPPFADYGDNYEKGIIAVSDGPRKSTVVLGYINGVGQVLASSTDGKHWGSAILEAGYDFFNNLVFTDANELDRVIVYGTRRPEFLTSADSKLWTVWAFPNPCQNAHHCYFDNKHFDSIANGYILLQSKTLDDTETNKMYFTTNLTNWYHYSLPFEKDYMIKAFKGKNNVLMVSVISNEDQKTHKLWVTADYQTWNSFNLPEGSKVLDAKIDHENKIILLLSYKKAATDNLESLKTCDESNPDCDNDEDASLFNTDLVSLNPETNLSQTIHTFSGLAKSMHWFDNKLFLSGDFINDIDNKRAALVIMTKD